MRKFSAFFLLLFLFCLSSCDQNRTDTGNSGRELRYLPEGSDFVFRADSARKFNRALYGNNQAFRLETGDVPEFGFYRSVMSGNLRFALLKGNQKIWLHEAKSIDSRYRPGLRIYNIQDPVLGKGSLELQALARYDSEGALFRFEFHQAEPGLQLIAIYGGARGKRFSRDGDMGADPYDAFELKTAYCQYNQYKIQDAAFQLWYGASRAVSGWTEAALNDPANKLRTLHGIFPDEAKLQLGNAEKPNDLEHLLHTSAQQDCPLLLARLPLDGQEVLFIALGMGPLAETPVNEQTASAGKPSASGRTSSIQTGQAELELAFEQALQAARQVAGRLRISSPDPYLNAMGGALAMAADAIWESPSYLHGSIGWRSRLAGWRGAYTGDVLGWHDRAREHFRAYGASQMTLPPDKGVIMDTALNLARSAKVAGSEMYSSGYIARYPDNPGTMNHYDMNLCYIDELLWHFRWTGDLDFVREMWPVLTRHLAWEKRCFDPDDDGLYDAYCCIWASDALQYNGGAVTHSTAYNYRANEMAAELAALIGEDSESFRREADKIRTAVNRVLWLPQKGHWAEFRDAFGLQRLHEHAAVWTIYHAIDAGLHDAFTGWQALNYIEHEIPHIPVRINTEGLPEAYLPEKDLAMISTSNWQPYVWSVNNVAFAEVMHTALACFRGGRPEMGYKLMKSAVMDGMYLGGSPGNVGQISYYDAARGEVYRDFADVVGVYSRAVVQGLYGIEPDLLHNRVYLRPGFPAQWDSASIAIPDLSYRFEREGNTSRWQIHSNFDRDLEFVLELPLCSDQTPLVRVNGQALTELKIISSVEKPLLQISCPAGKQFYIEITEQGNSPEIWKFPAVLAIGEAISLPLPEKAEILDIRDPQSVLEQVEINKHQFSVVVRGKEGPRSFFALLKQAELSWWQVLSPELRPRLEIIPETDNQLEKQLSFHIRNNSLNQALQAELFLNGEKIKTLSLAPLSLSTPIRSTKAVRMGSNLVEIRQNGTILAQASIINWNLAPASPEHQETIDLNSYYNDKLCNIFRFGKYLSPRSLHNTLQIPTQGIGDWCSPMHIAEIDDSGVRQAAGDDNKINTKLGLQFASPGDSLQNNILFVSRWDNYPNSVRLDLEGKARHAYMLMAGSTNHMQYGLPNGKLSFYYRDGSCDSLLLINPENWPAIEQDAFDNGLAFSLKAPRPWRMLLSTGEMTKEPGKLLQLKGAANRYIPGGAATVLDLTLNPDKELSHIEFEALSNEVVLGLMSLTLIK
ncbi:MAG: DUF4450 domain-containing protein [Bacteroidales bacterium]|nr:DUF4450 domain-containing protein [Bacteroidales bacterium]